MLAIFAKLYRLEASRLWRAMFAYTGDREVANDVVVEAFAQCFGARPKPGSKLCRVESGSPGGRRKGAGDRS